MKHAFLAGVALATLSACAPKIPESGVGFGDYDAYQTQQALAAPTVSSQPIGQSELTAAGIGTDPNRTEGVQASPSNAAPAIQGNVGISDEQDFAAVSSRETIESDAERRAAQAAAYEVVTPTALPQRDGEEGPNIIEYALNAPNVKGQEWYSRLAIPMQWRYEQNCAKFTSPDEAQREFLRRGGPQRDPMGIDPDGDGFACAWDPAPFLLALQAAN